MTEAHDPIAAMPAGGAEPQGESIWAAAEKLAAAHEAKLTGEGKPIPGKADVDPSIAADVAELEAKPKPAAKAKTAEPVADGDKSALRAEMERLAVKLGMKVDGNRVEVAERVQLREERRRLRESVDREVTTARAKIAEDAAKVGNSLAFEKAREANDLEGMAKAAGFENWKALVNEHTKRMSSPEYREIQELKKRDAEREQSIKQQEAQRVEAEQRQLQATNIQQYKAAMADELKTHGGQLERMTSDPDIIDLLYQCRADHYKATGEELDLVELTETPARSLGGKSPLDLLRSKWEALNEVFGDHPADQDEAASAATRRGGQSSRSREQKKPPKTVSQRNAAEASATPTFDDSPEGQRAYKEYFTSLLNQSTHAS